MDFVKSMLWLFVISALLILTSCPQFFSSDNPNDGIGSVYISGYTVCEDFNASTGAAINPKTVFDAEDERVVILITLANVVANETHLEFKWYTPTGERIDCPA